VLRNKKGAVKHKAIVDFNGGGLKKRFGESIFNISEREK
jgi:hypothetical protein